MRTVTRFRWLFSVCSATFSIYFAVVPNNFFLFWDFLYYRNIFIGFFVLNVWFVFFPVLSTLYLHFAVNSSTCIHVLGNYHTNTHTSLDGISHTISIFHIDNRPMSWLGDVYLFVCLFARLVHSIILLLPLPLFCMWVWVWESSLLLLLFFIAASLISFNWHNY